MKSGQGLASQKFLIEASYNVNEQNQQKNKQTPDNAITSEESFQKRWAIKSVYTMTFAQ